MINSTFILTKQSLIVVAIVATVVLGYLVFQNEGNLDSFGSNSSGTSEVDRQEVPPVPLEIKPALIALRRGDTSFSANELIWLKTDVLDAWMSKILVKGKTTPDDVAVLLGSRWRNLDRPQRDGIITKQIDLGGSTAGTKLVFDFDSNTGKLTDWSFSQWICGYCPHVFSYDGRWRLEGKLLAGCIGYEQEGTDTVLLPRLVERSGQLRIKVANLAPETEFIDQIQLGAIPLEKNEELDVACDGRPFAWTSDREISFDSETVDGVIEHHFYLDPNIENRVVVLELRNTSMFETAMRNFVFGKRPAPTPEEIGVKYDEGTSLRIKPVGTKFLRRVVIPPPAGAQRMTLRFRSDLWLVRRMWFGAGRSVESAMNWTTPTGADGPEHSALKLISQTDQRRLRLDSMQEQEFSFWAPSPASDQGRMGYVLRMKGYYQFNIEQTLN